MISINNYSEALKLAAWAMFEQYTSDVGTFIFGYMEEVNNKQDYPIILAVRGEFPLIAVDEKAVKITQKMVIGKKPIGKNPNIDIDLLQEYAIYFMRAINTLDKMRGQDAGFKHSCTGKNDCNAERIYSGRFSLDYVRYSD